MPPRKAQPYHGRGIARTGGESPSGKAQICDGRDYTGEGGAMLLPVEEGTR